MTPDDLFPHIPPEVVDAAWDAYIRDGYRPSAFRAAIAAGLAAWPGISVIPKYQHPLALPQPASLYIPLPEVDP